MNEVVEKAIQDQEALNELRAIAESPEDHADLDAQQKEIDESRAHAYDKRLGQLTIQDGVVVEKADVESARSAGHEVSGPYKGGQR
jgi:hypothetical protein